MFQEPLVKAPHHFPGITILIPKQRDNEIVAVVKGSLIPDKIPSKTENFTLIRHVANIVLLTRSDYDRGLMNPVKSFDPPVEIRVGYHFQDVMKSNGDFRKLVLAYWDGSQWVALSEKDNEFTILPPETAQVAEAKIWSWVGDPPIAWGM